MTTVSVNDTGHLESVESDHESLNYAYLFQNGCFLAALCSKGWLVGPRRQKMKKNLTHYPCADFCENSESGIAFEIGATQPEHWDDALLDADGLSSCNLSAQEIL